MRTKLVIGSLFFIACVLVMTIILGSGSTVTTSLNASSESQLPTSNTNLNTPARSQIPKEQYPGARGITPSIASHKVGTPSFTVSDVRAYLDKSPQAYVEAPTTNGQAPTIRDIEFITSREANARLKTDSTGLPDTSLVCWVELYGPFDMSKVDHPPQTKPFTTANTAVEIFDAETGNLLMSSSRP